MFNGKMKAVTFSYDDCTTQDIRLVELFNMEINPDNSPASIELQNVFHLD